MFRRARGFANLFYYQLFNVTVQAESEVTFIGGGLRDIFGLLYRESFDSWNVQKNLLAENDDGGGSLKFMIKQKLNPNETYFLIVTTFSPFTQSSFEVTAESRTHVLFQNISRDTNFNQTRQWGKTCLREL